METLIITIPTIPRQVKVAEAQRPKYYKKGQEIPKKYQTPNFIFRQIPGRKSVVLYDITTNQPVIKNHKTVGQPRYYDIRGNDLWDVKAPQAFLEQVKISLQEYFWQVIKHIYADRQLPNFREVKSLRVHMIFYSCNEAQDTDNLDLFYRKAFGDAIQDNKYNNETRLVPNDKVIKSFWTDLQEVATASEEKLVIHITQVPYLVLDKTKVTISSLPTNILNNLNKGNNE